MAAGEDVYCTLVLNDAYLPGASVLSHSLRDCGTTRKLACLVNQEALSAAALDQLRALYNYVIPVPRIGNPNPSNLYLMDRADLLYAFTKIHLWRQTQFRKIVYLDADVVALRAPEELFEIEDKFAAAPDVGWPDAFNTGVMVLAPDEGVYRALQNMASAGDSFDGADQGLLNQYFENKPWKRLSFTYNCTPSANYQYEPAYRYHKSKISLLHFIGRQKPWTQHRAAAVGSGVYQELLSQWWAVHDRHSEQAEPAYQVQQPLPQEQPSAAGYAPDIKQPEQAPALSTQVEHPLTDTPRPADRDPGSQHSEPIHTFHAPQAAWDGTQAPPPVQSRPEAANFPSQIYEFNADPQPFQPPVSYPEPPKNMWFEVPPSEKRRKPAEKLPAIFPWEEREMPRPARRFIEDESEPEPISTELEDESPDMLDVGEFAVEADTSLSSTPIISVSEPAAWDAFGTVNRNAWDEISGIDSYIRALTSRQKTRGQVQVIQNNQTSTNPSKDGPLQSTDLSNLADTVQQRRESLILTDFPTAIERPSLPVTPAPRRRATFWGNEGEVNDSLPSAEGVPDQVDWDPAAQLEQLRRSSLLGPEQLQLPAAKSIPNRAAIPSAASATETEQTIPLEVSTQGAA